MVVSNHLTPTLTQAGLFRLIKSLTERERYYLEIKFLFREFGSSFMMLHTGQHEFDKDLVPNLPLR